MGMGNGIGRRHIKDRRNIPRSLNLHMDMYKFAVRSNSLASDVRAESRARVAEIFDSDNAIQSINICSHTRIRVEREALQHFFYHKGGRNPAEHAP